MTTLAPSFLNGSSSFLQVMRRTIEVWMSSKFALPTTELAALEVLKNRCIML